MPDRKAERGMESGKKGETSSPSLLGFHYDNTAQPIRMGYGVLLNGTTDADVTYLLPALPPS